MCGIAGVYSLSKTKVDLSKADSMLDVLQHRGPDGKGEYHTPDECLMLLHRRLSIIDLSDAGAQPMISDDSSLTIVFNGEIYNYIEVREQLRELGCSFKSDSDTEVILQAYKIWGRNCLSYFEGMFAFALFDHTKNELFCARDRFGEKPFFYSLNNGVFVFASEIKAIRAYFGKVNFNKQYVQHYLNSSSALNDLQTFFEDIVALPPASFMIVKNGEAKIDRYWEIEISSKNAHLSEEECVNQFKLLFEKSIANRLRSDVPVGSSLSGGLDSSSIVCMLKEMNVHNMHTFSARFEGPTDEGKWISEVIDKTGFPNHEVWPDPDSLINELESMVWHQEFPPGSSSVFAQWCVMKLPRTQGVKVLLDGQGADEYLAGYDELKYYAIWDLYRRGRFGRFMHEWKLFNKNYGAEKSIGFSFLLDPFRELMGKPRSVYSNGKSLKEILRFYTTTKLGELLRYADRNSMANSIEIRLPFLYHPLVEFIFSINPDFIYSNGKTKSILRKAMDGVLPEGVGSRTDKIGFAPPQKSWLDNPLVEQRVLDAEKYLKSLGFEISNDKFRNLATSVLLKKFA